MKRVFIVHRWSGGPGDDWRPWLKQELEAHGWQVSVPAMPDTDVPVIEKWVGALAAAVGAPDAETYFVGHSIGCQTILRYLETVGTPIGGAVFVAGWFDLENLEDEETAVIARPWIEKPISFNKVKASLSRSTLVISDNDPYGAFDKNKESFGKLGSKIVVVPSGGHFTEEEGCSELPLAITELEALTPQVS